MKTTITTATLALLLATAAGQVAMAQDDGGDHRHGDHQGQGGQRQGGQGHGGQPPAAAPAAPAAPPHAQAAPQAQVPPRWAFTRPRAEQQRAPEAVHPAQTPYVERGAPPAAVRQGDRREGFQGAPPSRDDGDHRNGGWDRRDWDRHDQGRVGGDHDRWERGRFPPIYQSPRRFHLDRYRAPRGYYYRQWAFGDFLPRGWFGPDYLLGDFYAYGLPYPPPGYEWVRVGEDALLVDRYTGRIVQVVRFVFW
jgi:Ni/Co efflux regulator RcnB